MPKAKGQIESQISEALIKFEREYMGRGPEETKTYILEDIIVVRLKRLLTPAEQQLAQGGADAQGRTLVKQVRSQLIEKARPLLEAVISDITDRKVVCLHTDISTVTGERVIVFTMDGRIE